MKRGSNAGGELLEIGNSYYTLQIGFDEWISPFRLTDKVNKQVYADGEYSYSMVLDNAASSRLVYNEHSLKRQNGKGIFTFKGKMLFDNSMIDDIQVIHQFTVYENQPYLDEKISVLHKGSHSHLIEDIKFGFRKPIMEPYARRKSRAVNDMEGFQFVAVPFGHSPEPAAPPLKPNPRVVMQLQDIGFQTRKYGAEGWVWTNQHKGMLVCKYSPNMIEHSIMQSERVGKVIMVRFGGGSPWRGDPEASHQLGPSGHIEFGTTRYVFYKGDWKKGFYLFREYMSSLGHGLPDKYNPPLNYCSWYDCPNEYDSKRILKLAKLISELRCELLFLDQTWETTRGSGIWDTKRMGRLNKFVQKMKKEFGLGIGLHIISDSYNLNDFQGRYRKDKEGKEYLCDWFWGVCFASPEWQKEKTMRLLNLVRESLNFISFDYHLWAHDLNNPQGCYDGSHGHSIPLTREEHCRGLVKVIQNIRREYPGILIEMHDPILSGRPARYTPYYYLHSSRHSFDETWGSEFMHDPMKDILSGDALSLYYYNLAYELPTYLHIDMRKDNDNLLAFWWFASTNRHLGIGGMQDVQEKKFQNVKHAIEKYIKLRKFFNVGSFFGIDECTHVHALPEKNEAVVCVFNLESRPVVKELEFYLHDIGLSEKSLTVLGGNGFSLNKEKMRISVECNPLSPVVLEIRRENTG